MENGIFKSKFQLLLAAFAFLLLAPVSIAQEGGAVNYYNKSTLFLSPQSGAFIMGSTFDVALAIDTNGESINAFEINLKFPPDKIQVVRTGGVSIASLWVEPPTYSNKQGRINMEGGILGGINTKAGILVTVTFKAINTGQATVEILPTSTIMANDGLATIIPLNLGRGVYTLALKPPEGPEIFSETHPFSNVWSNNNNPVFTWSDLGDGVDFSYELDNKPNTIPDNMPDTRDRIKSYENVGDGLWYFHLKARRGGVWGIASHMPVMIDTTPPAEFKPRVEILGASLIARALIFFSTTDALSGMSHYEVGVVDRTKSPNEAPVFIETQSPYQLAKELSGALRVIVRAIDKAGNVKDASVDVYEPGLLNWPFKYVAIFGTLLAIIIYLIFCLFKRRRKNNEDISEN